MLFDLNRGWPARFAIVGLTIGTLGFSGKAAGLAAFGRALSIPIWLVLTAGGSLLGTIIQELQSGQGIAGVEGNAYTPYGLIEICTPMRTSIQFPDHFPMKKRNRRCISPLGCNRGSAYLTTDKFGEAKTNCQIDSLTRNLH